MTIVILPTSTDLVIIFSHLGSAFQLAVAAGCTSYLASAALCIGRVFNIVDVISAAPGAVGVVSTFLVQGNLTSSPARIRLFDIGSMTAARTVGELSALQMLGNLASSPRVRCLLNVGRMTAGSVAPAPRVRRLHLGGMGAAQVLNVLASRFRKLSRNGGAGGFLLLSATADGAAALTRCLDCFGSSRYGFFSFGFLYKFIHAFLKNLINLLFLISSYF